MEKKMKKLKKWNISFFVALLDENILKWGTMAPSCHGNPLYIYITVSRNDHPKILLTLVTKQQQNWQKL